MIDLLFIILRILIYQILQNPTEIAVGVKETPELI
jgi:hypothetical protein